MKKEAIRVVTSIPAAPTTLYYAWLSTEQHSAMTGGAPSKIDPTVGAKFSALGGNVSGKLVILDLGRRLVMAWRSSDFPRDAHDSRVEMHLEALGGSTRITLIQTEIPEGLGEKVRTIWNDQYFGPMRAFFSKFLPDPRNPPPPRRPPPPPEEEEEETPPAKSGKGPHVSVGTRQGKPASAKPSSTKPIIAKPAPKAAPPPKSEKKPEPKKAAAPPPPAKKKAVAAAPPPPKKKAAAAPAKPKKPEKKPEKKPAKKVEKAKPKKKK